MYECLKEYYEIIDEAHPLSGFFPTHGDFVYRNTFLIMKLGKPPSFIVIRALIASQSTFEIQLLSYCFLYLILHEFCSVLICDILGIGLL